MALSVKVALLTCLFFTGGICWLVNQVARPANAQPHALAKRPPQELRTPIELDPVENESKPAQLERESPVARSREISEPASRTVLVPEITLVSGPPADQPIPPLHNPLLEMRTAAEHAQRDARLSSDRIPDAVYAMETEPSALLEAHRVVTPYTVARGDSLSRICRAQYGDRAAEGQKLLMAANPQIARRAGFTIYRGETLQIPAIDITPTEEIDAGGMEASASFVTQIEPAPDSEPVAGATRPTPKRTANAGKSVKTPPKADTARKNANAPRGKASAKAAPPKNAERAIARGPNGGKKGPNAVHAPAESRGSKSSAAAARRAGPAPAKAVSGKRAPNPDKRDARRSTGGNVMLARRD